LSSRGCSVISVLSASVFVSINLPVHTQHDKYYFKDTVRLFDSGRQQTNVDRESNTENMYTVKNIRAAGQLILQNYD